MERDVRHCVISFVEWAEMIIGYGELGMVLMDWT
jgi:hypothetical protein